MRYLRALALATLVLGSCCRPAVAGTGVPDEQLWTEVDVEQPLGRNYSITGVGQLRVSESLANPIFTAAGLDVDHSSGAWTLGVGYRHQVTGDRQGEDINVTQVARFNVTWRHQWGRSTLALRSRLEDVLTASSNPWRARVRAEYRWATENAGPVRYLYTNDEVFYQFSDGEFFRNRFQIGMRIDIGKRASLLTYYQRQDSREQTPGAINALGLTLGIALR